MWSIRDNDINVDNNDNDVDMDNESVNKINDTSLSSLSDGNKRNRKLMFEYWGNEQRLSVQS